MQLMSQHFLLRDLRTTGPAPMLSSGSEIRLGHRPKATSSPTPRSTLAGEFSIPTPQIAAKITKNWDSLP